MTDPTPTWWPRPLFEPGGRPAVFEFFVFFDGPPAMDPLPDLRGEGHAAIAPDPAVLAQSMRRADDRAHFDPLFLHLGDTATDDPALAARVRAAQGYVVVHGRIEDPPTLGYLQGAWAAVRAVARRGGFAVYDNRANRWWAADALLALPTHDNRPACGWRVLDHTAPGASTALFSTRGLIKFGRPEMVALVDGKKGPAAAKALLALGHAMILGRRLRSGDRIEIDGVFVRARPYTAGFSAPDVRIDAEEQPLQIDVDAA